jgi:hypothetical protein
VCICRFAGVRNGGKGPDALDSSALVSNLVASIDQVNSGGIDAWWKGVVEGCGGGCGCGCGGGGSLN